MLAWCLYFAVLGDPGTLGSTRKDTLRSRLDFLWIFGGFRDPFESFVGFLEPKQVYFVMLVSKLFSLMIFGSESGCLRLENQVFGMTSIAK